MANPDFAYIDGFDHYSDKGDGTIDVGSLLTREWTSLSPSTPGALLVTALSGPAAGAALRLSGTNGYFAVRKSVPGNYARNIGGVTIKIPTITGNAGNAVSVALYDSTTAQLSINVNWITGTISVRRGDGGATIIATSTEAISAGSTFVLEWDITIHNTTGIIKVYLNGVICTALNLTGQNTRVSANNFYNGVSIGMYGIDNGSRNADFDHFYSYCYTASGGSETPLLNAPVIETQVGTSDDTAQFTAQAGVLGKDYRTTTATNAPGAGQLVLMKYTPEVNATLQSVALVPAATSAAAKFKAVLYSDSAGSPNALVATGTEVTGCTSGTTLTMPFGSGQALTGGTAYWIGYITDTSVAIQQYDSTTNLGQKKANTYASGAPNPAGAMTAGQPTWEIWGNMTGPAANYAQENKGEPTLNEYNQSSTVSQKDMFNFPALTITPSSIAMVAVKVAGVKSDGGARTINLPTKSGASTGNGTNAGISPGISLAYLTSNFFTDPNTSAAWTAANLNAAKSGYEIAS